MSEVIAALKKVQAEGRKANQDSAKGLNSLTGAARELKRFLPTLGVGAAVAGAIALGRQAARTAGEINDLAQSTGSSVENFSVLAAQATITGTQLSTVGNALSQLAQNLLRLREGNAATSQAFAKLNLEAEDFIGLDTAQAAVKIANALKALEDPVLKAAVAKQVLGKSGSALIPLLNDLGGKSFPELREEAERLGVVIDSDLARATTEFTKNSRIMGLQVRGLATSFLSEFLPAVSRSMAGFQQATEGSGTRVIRAFGNVVGETVGAIINTFRLLAAVVTGVFDQIGIGLAATAAAINQAVRLNFDEAKVILDETATDLSKRRAEANKETISALEALIAELTGDPPKVPAPEIEPPDPDATLPITEAQRKAALDAAKARAAAELSVQQEKLRAEAEANERAFEQGLKSLQQFSDKRREIIERNARIQIAAIRAEQAAIAGAIDSTTIGDDADNKRAAAAAEIAKLENDVRVRQLALARELAAEDGDRLSQARALTDELKTTTAELKQLEGDRHALFQANLEQELRDVRELGKRAGLSAAEISSVGERLSQARTGRFNFDEATRAGTEALAAFERDARRIQLDQEAGIISQFEGELRLIELQRQRLATLKELAKAAQQAAAITGDPELIARADQYADSVAQVAASFQQATDIASKLKNASLEAFEGGLADLGANIQDVESLEDAFRSLASTVASTMQRIASEILARQAIFALLRTFGGGSSGIAQAVATGWLGGRVRAYAGGGDIRGPRLPIPGPDKVPILAAEGEFMLRRARVREPGALAFLRAWNAGHFTFEQAMRLPRFESGGLVGGAAAQASSSGENQRSERFRIVNVLDPRLAIDALNTASGEEVIMNIIDRNAEKIRTRLGA